MRTDFPRTLGDQIFDAIADHWPGALVATLLLSPLMLLGF